MTLVTDNASNICSRESELFLSNNSVRYIMSATYQPSTNGQAENAVKNLKMFLKHCDGADWKTKLDKFLFQYRVTPHQTTGVSPAELMFRRKLRTVLDLAHPGINAYLTQRCPNRINKRLIIMLKYLGQSSYAQRVPSWFITILASTQIVGFQLRQSSKLVLYHISVSCLRVMWCVVTKTRFFLALCLCFLLHQKNLVLHLT